MLTTALKQVPISAGASKATTVGRVFLEMERPGVPYRLTWCAKMEFHAGERLVAANRGFFIVHISMMAGLEVFPM